LFSVVLLFWCPSCILSVCLGAPLRFFNAISFITYQKKKKLLRDKGDLFSDPSRYRSMVGKLHYLAITRPAISYAVSVVSQFLEAPKLSHWDVVIHIIRYLKRAQG
jgi:hypothetical protein